MRLYSVCQVSPLPRLVRGRAPAGEFRDADDQPIRNWGVDESRRGVLLGPAERRVEELEDQVEGLQNQFNDLAERVDFAERMLAQQRERPQLPRG